MSKAVRTFVAVELPPEAVQLLSSLIHRLRSLGLNAIHWVRPQSVHLTLKFLGDVEVVRLPHVCEVLAQTAQTQHCFQLRLQGAGTFPPFGSPRVVWVGLSGDVESLQQLQHHVEESLARWGFPLESRLFVPHLTLGRVRGPLSAGGRKKLWAALDAIPVDMALTIEMKGVSLMRSILKSPGAHYERLCLRSFHGPDLEAS